MENPNPNPNNEWSNPLDRIPSPPPPPIASPPPQSPTTTNPPQSHSPPAAGDPSASSSSSSGEEPSAPKKQKPLSSFSLNPQSHSQSLPPLPSSSQSKKPKKKSNNVWTKSTSRKGKKKTKPNNSTPQPPEDNVLITPIARFPDKSDDSPDAAICLSRVYKAEKVELSENRLSAASTKGYRMVRATRGVVSGDWYFEIRVVRMGESGHARLGWTAENGDLQAPVGYDANGYGYRDVDGCKIHKALREEYGKEGYGEGDVIGFCVRLPEGEVYAPKPPNFAWYKGQRYMYSANGKDDPPKIVPGELFFFGFRYNFYTT